MTTSGKATTRLVFDLQACQAEASSMRGVGRYSKALYEASIKINSGFDHWVLLSENLFSQVEVPLSHRNRVQPIPALPDWTAARQFQGGGQDQLDGLALSALIAPLHADIVHVSHVFEGFAEPAALPSPQKRLPGQILSATIYDLIPLLFQDFYFQNENFRKFYLSRLDWLRKADLLLAISESTRQDAISLLGIEPSRITTIYGGILPHFKVAADRETVRAELAQRYALPRQFILYTGGDDHRKNISGAISGYAAVAPVLRRDSKLVIVCAMEEHRCQMYLNQARQCGLNEDEVLLCGHVSEADLLAFTQTCSAFIFPSLYEGLGLPVLEAMACGAPVIGSNNSSIRELIARPDAMFDGASPQSIAQTLSAVLSNPAFARDLSDYGIERAKKFSWDESARLAGEAFSAALERARYSGVQSAVSGWLPRKRIAILTPLPPCRSGIADYNAKFLPYLSRHFEIDVFIDHDNVSDENLSACFRIFPVARFDALAKNYFAILYEFGNSEFHHHMLPLLEKYPGVVGLHDAFLSGMFGYIDFNLGNSGSYAREMIAAHGPQARRLLAPAFACPEPVGRSMVDLPCTKKVLALAIGIISHSPFNLEVAREHYPEGWRASYRTIAQMINPVSAWSPQRRDEARARLGYGKEDVILATFGHINWLKLGDRLLEAFCLMASRSTAPVHLVYVGEMASDQYGTRLQQAIQASGLASRIRVTGYLDEADYLHYLHIVDLAVQLRKHSRGGTPKGVLDCLAHGVPVAVNNEASYRDYSEDVVIKLSADPAVEEIAERLEQLCLDANSRQNFAASGLEYVSREHDPAMCAAKYAAAIHEFSSRAKQSEPLQAINDFAPYLAKVSQIDAASERLEKWFDAIPVPAFARRKLYIDVSHIAQFDHCTGIQRVVKKIVHSLYGSARADFEPVAVELIDGTLKVADKWLAERGLSVAAEAATPAPGPIVFKAGDVMLMLDSSWAKYREFYPMFEQARRVRVPVLTVIYDLLPIVLPSGDFVAGGREWFEGWFRDAVQASDGLICISQATAQDVCHYIDRAELANRPNVGYWHLGSDFSAKTDSGKVSEQVQAMAALPYILMVGTIEPRKSHVLALDAMEKLWAEGHNLCLCIAGKGGWMVEQLMDRIRNHPAAGSKLFLFEAPADDDINFLYKNTKALLFLSKGEGFGLPLVEAANHGAAIICSDIPVFHEIAGEFATYVDNTSPDRVAQEIEQWWSMPRSGKLQNTHLMPRLTWEQSASSLLEVVFDNRWFRN
ncbi:MAG: glycosyltransferase [Methylobacter sp.]